MVYVQAASLPLVRRDDVSQRVRKDGVLGVKDLGAAFLKAWIRGTGLERVVHPDVCLKGIRVREQAWATLEWALFLIV